MDHYLRKYYNYVIDSAGNLVQGLTIPIDYKKRVINPPVIKKNINRK